MFYSLPAGSQYAVLVTYNKMDIIFNISFFIHSVSGKMSTTIYITVVVISLQLQALKSNWLCDVCTIDVFVHCTMDKNTQILFTS